MSRVLARHRFASSVGVVLLMLSLTGILFTTHSAYAFTLFPSSIIYDPISVVQNQSVHIHALNNAGSAPFGVVFGCKPTEKFLGLGSGTTATVLNPGDGMDATIAFAGLNPNPGVTRLPVVCTIDVVGVPPTTPVPPDFSARLVTSVEIIDDATNRQVEILGSRHVQIATSPTTPPVFCLFCN